MCVVVDVYDCDHLCRKNKGMQESSKFLLRTGVGNSRVFFAGPFYP